MSEIDPFSGFLFGFAAAVAGFHLTRKPLKPGQPEPLSVVVVNHLTMMVLFAVAIVGLCVVADPYH